MNLRSGMDDKEYFFRLYEIARILNKEFSLHSLLQKALKKTVELLYLETGWIWLMQEDNKSVYLAATYNLPPALSRHPERLSGSCFCIDKYLASGIETGLNISEITCTRLHDITSGTRGLKFHATIPISIEGRKVGLINLVSKETQQLTEEQLSVLNTISELISIAVQRTRVQESYGEKDSLQEKSVRTVLSRVIAPGMEELISRLQDATTFAEQSNHVRAIDHAKDTLTQGRELFRELSLILGEGERQDPEKPEKKRLHYPASPLTRRELEVLALVKKGYTNKQIAEQLYVSERTVKFHVSSILSKLLARTRTEAIATAIQRGLLSF